MPNKPRKAAISFHNFLQKVKRHLTVAEESLNEATFYIYRTDTYQILARGIEGFDAAKERARSLRKQHGLKWDQVKFKAQPRVTSSRPTAFSASPRDQDWFTTADGHRYPVEYSPVVNPSK